MALARYPNPLALLAWRVPATMAIVASGVLALAPVPGIALPAAPAAPAGSAMPAAPAMAAAPPLGAARPASSAPAAPAASPAPPALPATGAPQERIRFEEISVRAGAHIPHHARIFAARNGGVL